MNLRAIKKVAIIGVGLMGGSFALALKGKIPTAAIVGYARSKKTFHRLKALGILDAVERDLAALLSGADLIVLALPVSLIVGYLARIGPMLKPGALVIDLGSTKNLVEKTAKCLPRTVHFVGCHPLCGSEKSGAAASRKDLYRDAVCLITTPASRPASKVIARLWRMLGCRVAFISALKHDRILSAISHLPHIISFALTKSIPTAYGSVSVPSLKDLTRIAGSPANIWTDIFISNAQNILADIDNFMAVLSDLRAAIVNRNTRVLTRIIAQANKKHSSFL
ncbi:MAG: prephenate dehydrogenase [Candidatus Omnitrophota bacterium]|nr:prephenate dehydrogenase [Candidatus Omnitrophota bacterium]